MADKFTNALTEDEAVMVRNFEPVNPIYIPSSSEVAYNRLTLVVKAVIRGEMALFDGLALDDGGAMQIDDYGAIRLI